MGATARHGLLIFDDRKRQRKRLWQGSDSTRHAEIFATFAARFYAAIFEILKSENSR